MAEQTLRLSLPLSLLALLLTGCGRSAQERLVGRWQGRLEFDDAKVEQKLQEVSANPIQKAVVEKLIEGAKSGTMDFELKRDGSFTLTTKVGRVKSDTYGQWEVLDAVRNQATVRLTDHAGKVETATITFVDINTVTTDAPEQLSDVAIFKCRRIR